MPAFILAPLPWRTAVRHAPPRCTMSGDVPLPNASPPKGPQYEPLVSPGDPIVSAIEALPAAHGRAVAHFEHLDTRWNGNEAYRVDLDVSAAAGEDAPKSFFVKFNRVEDPQVFMSEAIGLTEMLQVSAQIRAPRPLHVGRLPRVGAYGPGAFQVLQYFDLAPFGAQRPGVQRALAEMLATMHDTELSQEAHQGRFGFRVSNYLALTPMDNTWSRSWVAFFAQRLARIVSAAFKDKPYGRSPLDNAADAQIKADAQLLCRNMDVFFRELQEPVTPSLLHGDLWIGNVSATKASEPVIYDPACFYGHAEFDLALPRMFGGFVEEFWDAYFERRPKAPGFDERAKLYEMYQYVNQLNLFGDPEVKTKISQLLAELVALLPKSAAL